MSKIRASITGLGSFVPSDVLTNKDLEQMVDTTNDWIFTRTGILERRILKDPDKPTSYMAIQACRQLLEKTNTDPNEIDMLIVATVTPDMHIASTAVHVLTEIGSDRAFGYDLQAACSGFLYALSTGSSYIESRRYKKIIVVGADKMSSIVDYTDRATCILFGDGAGAVLLEPDGQGFGFYDEYLRSDSIGRNFLKIEAGGSLMPVDEYIIKQKKHFLRQEGQAVFKHAVANMEHSCNKILDRNNLDQSSIDWLVPHQANQRIMSAIANNLKIDNEKVMSNVARYGNTTSATLPLALSDYEHLLKKNDRIIMTAFGGGFTWGANYLKWSYDMNT